MVLQMMAERFQEDSFQFSSWMFSFSYVFHFASPGCGWWTQSNTMCGQHTEPYKEPWAVPAHSIHSTSISSVTLRL